MTSLLIPSFSTKSSEIYAIFTRHQNTSTVCKSYNQFEMNVRKEYHLVPYFIYQKKRKEILQMFLKQDSVYQVQYFRGTSKRKFI